MRHAAWILGVFLLASGSFAQKVQSTLSNDRVFVGQTTFLQVTVDPAARATMTTPPAAAGLKFTPHREGQGNRSSRMTIVNGRMTREDSIEYVFLFAVTPDAAGIFDISAPVVEVEGKSFTGSPARLVVEPESAQDLAAVVSTVDRPTWYRGESITLSVTVFLKHLPPGLESRDPLSQHDRSRSFLDSGTTPPTISLPWVPKPPAGLGEFPTVEWLNAQGMGQGGGLCLPGDQFARIRVTGQMSDVERPDREGKPAGYRQYRFVAKLLAESVGKYDLGAPTLEGKLVERRGREYVWREVFARGSPLSFEVVEPPSEARPASFTGAVGKFQLEMAPPTPSEVRVGDPVYLTLVLQGEGYLKGTTIDFERALGAGFRLDPPTILDSLGPNDKRPSGFPSRPGLWRQFEVKARPLDPKIAEIPAIEVACFDPQTSKYELLRTAPFPISVLESGSAASGVVVGARTAASAGASELSAVTLAPNIDDLNRGLARPTSPLLFLLLFGIPPLGLWSLHTWLRRRESLARDPARRRRDGARKRALERLAGAKARLATDVRGGCAEAGDAVRGFFSDLWDVPEEALTADEVARRLAARPSTAPTVPPALSALLSQVDALRFGGVAPQADQVRQWISEIEPCLSEFRRQHFAASLIGLALLLAPQGDSELFQRAQAAYQAGDYAAAADAFRACIEQHGENGAVLFNLGNSYSRAGELGRAIASYRRAERYLPTDENLRTNLDQALRRRAQDFSLPKRRAWYDYLWFWRPTTSFEVQAWLAVGLAWIASLLGFWAARSSRENGTLRTGASLLALVTLLMAASAVFTYREREGRALGVIIENDVMLREWPEASAPAGYDQAVHEGGEFRVREEREGWLHIRLADRYEGWIPSAQAQRY